MLIFEEQRDAEPMSRKRWCRLKIKSGQARRTSEKGEDRGTQISIVDN